MEVDPRGQGAARGRHPRGRGQ